MKRIFLYTILLAPIIFMASNIFIFENITEPVKYIYTITGISSTVILFFSICISMIKKKINLMKYRKEIGLSGFFYALLHLLNFVVFDAQLDLEFIINETFDKPFIYLGMIAFFILFFMTITSTKKLFKKYNKQHKLIYLALLLITIHLIMAQKSITIDDFCYIVVILIIAYYKLIQQIIRNNTI